jgi:DNA replication and repair protein RecF
MSRSIADLNIHQVRNILSASLVFHPQCNFIYGDNGSGKTTLLESIYLLCNGHSFRTREISPLVSEGESSLTVFAKLSTEETISIQKSLMGLTQAKINRYPCLSSSELARFLPCQVFYQNIFQVIDAGPSVRRSLLDWGLFHVEQSYLEIWKNYRLVLKQRNALLRQKAKYALFKPWDHQLATLAIALHEKRHLYFEQWYRCFQQLLPQLTDVPCTLQYYKGWDKKESGRDLATILEDQFDQDLQRQYTFSGAHQADIFFDLTSKKAKLLLSRGQQKIVLLALKLSQASLLEQACIYLFDDLTSELDAHHISRFIQYLPSINGQVFMTAMDDQLLRPISEVIESTHYRITQGVCFT